MNRTEKRKFHYIYKTTCLVTGRYYIGMHSTDNLNDGYMGSGKRLWRSFNKYGKNNHKVEILEFLSTRSELKEREKEMVNKELLTDKMCMNIQEGGGGGLSGDNHYLAFTKAGINNFNKTKDLRNKNLSLKRQDKNYRKKISDGIKNYVKTNGSIWLGKNHSEETKQKMSEKAKERTGNKNSQYGTCWITKDSVNKKIKKEYLNSWLSEGWNKGRK